MSEYIKTVKCNNRCPFDNETGDSSCYCNEIVEVHGYTGYCSMRDIYLCPECGTEVNKSYPDEVDISCPNCTWRLYDV